MRLSLLLLPLALLLSACQTAQLERDFDPNRDFAAYRSWSWLEPAVPKAGLKKCSSKEPPTILAWFPKVPNFCSGFP